MSDGHSRSGIEGWVRDDGPMWREVESEGTTDTGRRRSSLRFGPVVSLVAAAVLVSRGHRSAALAAVVLGFLLVQVTTLSPSAHGLIERGLTALARAFGRLLTALLLGLIEVVLFIPCWAAFTIAGLDPLHARRGGHWLARAEPGPRRVAHRAFAGEAAVRPSRSAPPAGHRWGRAVTIAVGLLAFDLLLGAVLGGTRLLPGSRGADISDTREWHRSWLDTPAYEGLPWARGYVRDLSNEMTETVPRYRSYLVYGEEDFASATVNVVGGRRVSYVASRPRGADSVRVAFFGGSTMFGEGQRDLHTIPSEFVRAAEAEGIRVEAQNFGVSAWVIWQEYLAFEQALARGEHYDLAIFYDGINEKAVQTYGYSPDPTNSAYPTLQEFAHDYHDQYSTYPGFLDGLTGLVDSYVAASGTARVIDRLKGTGGVNSSGVGYRSLAPEQDQYDAMLSIYRRAVGRILELADEYGVRVRFFWQPRRLGWPDRVLRSLPAETADISNAFDGHPDVYVDDDHTNEDGARLVARSLLVSVREDLRETHRATRRAPSDP